MRKYNRVYIDTETTGVDLSLHHVHQIGGIITTHDFTVLEKFNIRFSPFSVDGASSEALTKTRLTVEELANRALTYREAHTQLKAILGKHINQYDKTDKAHLIGFRTEFDVNFLRKLFDCCNDSYFGSWFWTPAIDLMSVSAWLLGDGRGALPNFKLETVCRAAELQWDETKAHDAMYDIEKTLELDKYLKSNFAN